MDKQLLAVRVRGEAEDVRNGSVCLVFVAQSKRAKWPNDPKLSDRGVRRGTCMAGGKAAAEAGAVTHGAVRCSAWLGRVRSELFEPSFIYGDVLNHFGLRAEAKFLELVGELVAVNEVDWWRTVSGGFLDGVA